MNYQALMKQAQTLQRDMLKTKEEIEKMEFEESNNLVTIKINGKKELISVKINSESLEKDDIEMVEDMITLALNQALKKVDEVTEQKMGKYSSLAGMF